MEMEHMDALMVALSQAGGDAAGLEPGPSSPPGIVPVETVCLIAISQNGRLRVADGQGRLLWADWLETGSGTALDLAAGDRLLALRTHQGDLVALGRIGRYQPQPEKDCLQLSAAKSLSLQCGEASLEMHADGKVMLRGQDVLLRAKRTQRIKAGTVNIN